VNEIWDDFQFLACGFYHYNLGAEEYSTLGAAFYETTY
jgi:hypothetical protein